QSSIISPQMPLGPGSKLGPYEILAALGAGGMGEVYRARDPRLGRDVAIKVLPAGSAGHSERMRRFEQEARATAALRRPNDLDLAKLTMPEPGAPGLSAEATLDSVTGRGALLGTLGYMSPEQCRGAAVDARSDLFSFGAVLYEMLSGRRAFRGDTTADTIGSILKEEPPDLSATGRDVPPLLERIVHHCLEKDPADRFQSARDIAFALEALSSISSPAASAKSSPAPAVTKPGKSWLV